ncbi:hypothetical protein [Hymenobacter psoromatis]|uniref:hypothetical protein n=1 Tax=Hymenobacter psoromatis TaxID=1484116 RepID=UPI001CBD94FC|nr:hypothetical protein [Hymenobacter psoromatis]
MRLLPTPLLLAALLGLSQCKKSDSGPAKPEDQLPPATQTGAHTFGCLLNGQPWTPSGNDGRQNFRLTYDPSYAGGSLTIRTYRYPNDKLSYQNMILGGDRIAHIGTYSFVLVGDRKAFFADHNITAPCDDFSEAPDLTYRTGSITITKLDSISGIISGNFNFKLAKPGCDTIKVTQGRFDYKL